MKKGLEVIQCPFCDCRATLVYDFSVSTIYVYCSVEGATYKLVEIDHILLENVISNLKKSGRSRNLWFLSDFEKETVDEILDEMEKQREFLKDYERNDKIEIKLSNN